MAISFLRPDPSSPAAVGSAQFEVVRRGYDQGEVRDFLRMVSAELARLQERERFLESEMRAMQTRGLSDPGVLDEATVTTLLGEETARVLSVAREAAQQMRVRAAESAERLVRDANLEVARMHEQADIEVARRLSDALEDSESEIELAKQQGREMVNEAREYSEKKLSELARRRELAKQEIEQLVRDRDRLMSAFERARLAANDVMGDLTEFDDADGDLLRAIPKGVVDRKIQNVVQFDREKFEDDTSEHSIPVVTDLSKLETVQQPFLTQEPDLVPELEVEKPLVQRIEKLVEKPVEKTVIKPIEKPVEKIVEEPLKVESEVRPETKTDEPDAGHRANVIQLFGRTSRRLHPSTDVPADSSSDAPTSDQQLEEVVQAVEPVQTVQPEQKQEPVLEVVKATPKPKTEKARVVPKKSGVDDLFAKLRQAGAGTVATSIKPVAPTESPIESPIKSTLDASSNEQKAPKADTKIFTKRDESLAPMIELLGKKLRRVLADEENSVLNYLQSKKAQVALETVLPSFDSQVQSFVEATSKDLIEIAMAGAQSLTKSLKADLRKKVSNTTVMQVMSKNLADTIVLPLRTRIQKCVEKSAGDSNEMSSLIRTVYREWKMQQIDKLVGDIARLAYSRGAYLVLDSGTKVCWMVDPNGPACSDAEDNSLAGAIARGEYFPTGHEHPVAHPGCRCLVVPSSR